MIDSVSISLKVTTNSRADLKLHTKSVYSTETKNHEQARILQARSSGKQVTNLIFNLFHPVQLQC